MSDLIGREQAIEAVYQALRKPSNDEVFIRIREALNGIPTASCWIPFKDLPPDNDWIPVSKRLPEAPYGCLVTVWDTNIVTMDEFENILPYFVGWDGEQWNDEDGEQCPFEVIAWMPLPEPYKDGERDG